MDTNQEHSLPGITAPFVGANDAEAYSRFSDDKTRNGFEDAITRDPRNYRLPPDRRVAAVDVVKRQALVFNSVERAAAALDVDEETIATILAVASDETTISLRTRTEWGFAAVPRVGFSALSTSSRATAAAAGDDSDGGTSDDDSDEGQSATSPYSLSDDSSGSDDEDGDASQGDSTDPDSASQTESAPGNDGITLPPSPMRSFAASEVGSVFASDDESADCSRVSTEDAEASRKRARMTRAVGGLFL